MADPSVVSQVKALNDYEKLLADPKFGPKIRNIYPLTGKAGTTRKTVKTLGKGTFGRVNLEELNEGNVATKYVLHPTKAVCENITEVATLRYLQGEPNVAQLIRVDPKPVSLAVNVVAPSIASNLPFPAIVMGKAIGTLDDNSLCTSWDDLFSTIKQVILGYYTLHTRGIIHRDTKPHNMLKTSLGEVWITDFGAAKYIDTNIPIARDNYTGTYWYSAPDLLMSHELQIEFQDYIQSDTWAVGASILHILRGRSPFMGRTIQEVLNYIFTIKGTPEPSDGVFFMIYEAYNAMNIFPIHGRDPDAIKKRVIAYTRFKPADPAVLEQIAEIVDGLLEYDPYKRMTISEALQRPVFGGSIPVVPPRKRLISDYINHEPLPPVLTPKRIYDVYSFLWAGAYREGLDLTSMPFVLDRTVVYTRSFFRIYAQDPYIKDSNLFLIGLVALFIASCLFDVRRRQRMNVDIIAQYGFTQSEVLECIRLYMIADIQFFGRTLLDEVLASFPGPATETEVQSFGYFNYEMALKNAFSDKNESADSIKEKIRLNPSLRKYFIEKIPLPPFAMPGGRRRTKKQKRGKRRISKKTQYNRHGRI